MLARIWKSGAPGSNVTSSPSGRIWGRIRKVAKLECGYPDRREPAQCRTPDHKSTVLFDC